MTKQNSHERAKKKIEDSKIKTPWMSVVDASVYLGVSKETIYRLVETKKIPSFKVGRLWKFNATDLDKWVKSGKASE